MALVIDSSAAIQIAMGSAEGLAMSGMIAKGEEVFAPDFLKLECANGFWRYVRARKLTAKQARELYQDSVSLATRFVRQNDLIDEALHEAMRLDHPVYDVAYLVLARRLDATLLSLDSRLVNLCIQEGVDCVEPVQL